MTEMLEQGIDNNVKIGSSEGVSTDKKWDRFLLQF